MNIRRFNFIFAKAKMFQHVEFKVIQLRVCDAQFVLAKISPEGELVLSQAVTYLALAPKSNAGYAAYKAARNLARSHGSEMPPKHILNAPTQLMADQGYGADYAYDHNAEDGFSGQNYFPETMDRPKIYDPVERGFERDLRKRVEYFEKLRAKRNASDT